MNKTNFYHALWAMAISILAYLLGLIIGHNLITLFAGALFFFAREQRDREMQLVKGIPPLESTLTALKFWLWQKDNLLDFLLPLAVSLVLFVVFCIAHITL